MPQIQLGVYLMSGRETENAVKRALEASPAIRLDRWRKDNDFARFRQEETLMSRSCRPGTEGN